MLTSLTLKNFRGFTDFKIPKLARVNLIGGVNNAGKTALLEAIFLLLQRDQNKIRQLPGLFRAASGVNDDRYFWRWIARDGNQEAEVSIAADIGSIGVVQVQWGNISPVTKIPSLTQHMGDFGGRTNYGGCLSIKIYCFDGPNPRSFRPDHQHPSKMHKSIFAPRRERLMERKESNHSFAK